MDTRSRYNGRIAQNEAYEAALNNAAFAEYSLVSLMNAGPGHSGKLGQYALKVTVLFLSGGGTRINIARTAAAGGVSRYKVSNAVTGAVLDFDVEDQAQSVFIQTIGGAVEMNIEVEYTLKG